MRYDPNKPFEVVFHIKGDKAKIINFKNVPYQDEIEDLIGGKNTNRYVYDSISCFLTKHVDSNNHAVPFLQIYDPSNWDRYSPNWNKQQSIELWSLVTIDDMKAIQEKVKPANERLSELIVLGNQEQDQGRQPIEAVKPYNPNEHFEVVFQTQKHYAKVVDFKNIPEWRETVNNIGLGKAEEYLRGSLNFFKRKNQENAVVPYFLEIEDMFHSYGGSRSLFLWEIVTIDEMKNIQKMEQQLNKQFDELLMSEGKIKKREGEER
jgi:hypothetical protein